MRTIEDIRRRAGLLEDAIDESGHYDPARLADVLGWTVADISAYLERDRSTVARHGRSARYQEKLGALASLFVELADLFGDTRFAKAWLRTPVRALGTLEPGDRGSTPRELIIRGEFGRVARLVEEMHSGFAA